MKLHSIGIRAETKNEHERRVPLTPEQVCLLKSIHNLQTYIQPSKKRAFSNQSYMSCGSEISDDLHASAIILGVKELPPHVVQSDKIYMIFSHTIKGQKENMPMLKKMIEKKCTLIDYEKITDAHGKRTVFFGRFAGYAGMIDTLAVLGKRLALCNIYSPLSEIKQGYEYESLDAARKHIAEIGERLHQHQLPTTIAPLVCGFAGYGNVSIGAQEMYDLLNVHTVSPQHLNRAQKNDIVKTIFHEQDMVTRTSSPQQFQLEEYYMHPERYQSVFSQYLPKLTLLINGIYWEKKYPRLVTKKALAEVQQKKLQVIGDISCDLNGAIEITQKLTSYEKPAFVYQYASGLMSDDLTADGVAVVAIDHLPSEFPQEASNAFGEALVKLIPLIARADFSVNFDELDLPDELKKATIVYRGSLTPQFQYLEQHVRSI